MILSVDLGSTSFKAAVYDYKLALRGRGGVSVEYVYGAGGMVEMNPAMCDQAVAGAIKQALNSAGVKPASLSGIGITSQAQTFALMAPSKRFKTRFLSWQDARSSRQAALLMRRRGMNDFAMHASFRRVSNGLLLAQFFRLRKEHPGLIRSFDTLLMLPTYFVWRWSAQAVADNNLAGMSGLYSLRLGRWWPAALSVCGLSASQLPTVLPVGAVGATTTPAARDFGLVAGLPIVLAGNDQTAGAYGARLHQTGRVLMTLGTAHALYACLSQPVRPGSALIRGPYPGGLFYRMEADSCGGNLVNWASKALGLDANSFLDLAATAPEGCQGLVFNPELQGGAGAWTGLEMRHTRADLARSVLEALVRRVAEMAHVARLRSNHCGVALAGGSSRHPIWRKLLNRALAIRITPVDAEPLTGAAAMALDAFRTLSKSPDRTRREI